MYRPHPSNRVARLWVVAFAALAFAACTDEWGSPEEAGIRGCSQTNVSAQGLERCSNVLARSDLMPEERLRALFERGMLHAHLGDSERARLDLEAIRELDPQSPLAPRGMAYLARAAENFPEELRQYDEALRLAPDDATLLGLRGTALYRLDRNREAFESLSAALDSDQVEASVLPYLYSHRGAVAVELGHGAVALSDFEEYERLAPTDEIADYWKGRALALSGHHGEASARFRAHLERNPDDARARSFHGLTLVALNDLPAAIAEFDAAVAGGISLGWLRGQIAEGLDVHLGPANASYQQGVRHALRVKADVNGRYASPQQLAERQRELFPPRIFRDPDFLFQLKTGLAPIRLHESSQADRMQAQLYFGALVNTLNDLNDPACQAIIHGRDQVTVALATTGDVLTVVRDLWEMEPGPEILVVITALLIRAGSIAGQANSDARMLATRHGCHSDVVVNIVEHGSTYVQWSMQM